MSPEFAALQPKIFVAHSSIRERIVGVISEFQAPVIYIEGIGGIGKTRILQEMEDWIKTINWRCSDIIDFYETRLHSPASLMGEILGSVSPNGTLPSEFQEVWTRVRHFGKGLPDLERAFLKSYQELTMDSQVILRFDTGELLTYPLDSKEVLQDCKIPIDMYMTSSLTELLELTSRLKNTICVIASRPCQELRKRILHKHPDCVVMEIEGFDLDATKRFFHSLPDWPGVSDGVSDEDIEKLHILSNGRPILLGLAMEWVRNGRWESSRYPDLAYMKKLKADANYAVSWRNQEVNWSGLCEEFKAHLVQTLTESDTDIGKAIRYASRARKGFDAQLLAALMQRDFAYVQTLIEELAGYIFVKKLLVSGEKEWYFLHDEMYSLIEDYVWWRLYPDYSEQRRLAEIIVGYYSERKDSLDEEIAQLPEESGAFLDPDRTISKERERQVLLTDRLYYLYDLDPQEGYDSYDQLDLRAERYFDWSCLLQSETQRFVHLRERRAYEGGLIERFDLDQDGRKVPMLMASVERNQRARWVQRLYYLGNHEQAIAAAENLLDKYPAEWGELWMARVKCYYGAALMQYGKLQECIEVLRSCLELLGSIEQQKGTNGGVLHFLKGEAHKYLGLTTQPLGQLGETKDHLSLARQEFEAINDESSVARLQNDIAQVFMLQGRLHVAHDLCLRAISALRKMGYVYELGLALSNIARILVAQQNYEKAESFNREAHQIFDRLNDIHGLSLTNYNYGVIYRGYAKVKLDWYRMWSEDLHVNVQLEDYKEAMKIAGKAHEHLKWVIENSTSQNHRIDALIELGCSLRNLAQIIVQYESLSEAKARMEEGMHYLKRALQLAKESSSMLQLADAYENLSRAYHFALRSMLVDAEEEAIYRQLERDNLEAAEELAWQEINRLFNVHKESSSLERLTESPGGFNSGYPIFALMAKIQRDYSHLAIVSQTAIESDKQTYIYEAARRSALSVFFASLYSQTSSLSNRLLADLGDWLIELGRERTEQAVSAMKIWLDNKGIVKCPVLDDYIDQVVKLHTGIGWPLEGVYYWSVENP